MKLILTGAGVMIGGLLLLLGMVARMIEPGLVISLAAYATAMGGMLISVAGAVSLSERPKG